MEDSRKAPPTGNPEPPFIRALLRSARPVWPYGRQRSPLHGWPRGSVVSARSPARARQRAPRSTRSRRVPLEESSAAGLEMHAEMLTEMHAHSLPRSHSQERAPPIPILERTVRRHPREPARYMLAVPARPTRRCRTDAGYSRTGGPGEREMLRKAIHRARRSRRRRRAFHLPHGGRCGPGMPSS